MGLANEVIRCVSLIACFLACRSSDVKTARLNCCAQVDVVSLSDSLQVDWSRWLLGYDNASRNDAWSSRRLKGHLLMSSSFHES